MRLTLTQCLRDGSQYDIDVESMFNGCIQGSLAIEVSASRSVGISKLTGSIGDGVGRTGFDTISLIPNPTLSLRPTGKGSENGLSGPARYM